MENLTKEQIREKAPSVFTQKPSNNVSQHYVHIPTEKIIDDMESLGWGVADVKEVKARKGIGFQKHLVIFRNPDITIEGEDGDQVLPQILLTNSHDAKNSFSFIAGLFRMICSNGLVISTQEFDNLKIRHMGYSFEELQNKISAMVKQLPLTVDSMNKMKAIELEEEQVLDFAKKALEVRFDKKQLNRVKIDIDDLVTPVRTSDEGNSLWNIFNTIQEKFIKGDFEYIAGNKTRKARKIKNFNQDIKVNKELFELALEYVS